MEDIKDLKIFGIDENLPPKIRKEPYFDLVFKLNQKASNAWFSDFNGLTAKSPYPAKIKIGEGKFVELWVRKSEELAPALDSLKKVVAQCTADFLARILAETNSQKDSTTSLETEGEQGRLNKIVAELDFYTDSAITTSS